MLSLTSPQWWPLAWAYLTCEDYSCTPTLADGGYLHHHHHHYAQQNRSASSRLTFTELKQSLWLQDFSTFPLHSHVYWRFSRFPQCIIYESSILDVRKSQYIECWCSDSAQLICSCVSLQSGSVCFSTAPAYGVQKRNPPSPCKVRPGLCSLYRPLGGAIAALADVSWCSSSLCLLLEIHKAEFLYKPRVQQTHLHIWAPQSQIY